jgi:trk system potassium uptake protein TrkA
MNIFVAGGGRVGFHLARLLAAENHDVTVIEADANRVEMIDNALDVRTVHGNAANVMLQNGAGAGKADLFVAVTGEDEANLVAAATAKGLGARRVMARVDSPTYIESTILYETILNIDFILSPEALAAMEIATYIENPGIVATEVFGRGRVKMHQIRVHKSPLATGETLKDLPLPHGVLLGMITRDGMTFVPRGDASVKVGDLVTLIGERERMEAVVKLFRGEELYRNNTIVIMGGSSVGQHLGNILDHQQRNVKIFDWNMQRCEELAAKFRRIQVICRDATSREALMQEHVNETDIFVSATKDDERNIMAGVLAKEVGVGQSVAVVHQPDFAPLVARLGIDHAVTPRTSIANRVLKLVHQGNITSLAVLEEGRVEIVEFPVHGDAAVIGKQLRDIKFPKGSLVAAILRGDHVIVPKGEDEMHADDSIIIIAAADVIDHVQRLFQR